MFLTRRWGERNVTWEHQPDSAGPFTPGPFSFIRSLALVNFSIQCCRGRGRRRGRECMYVCKCGVRVCLDWCVQRQPRSHSDFALSPPMTAVAPSFSHPQLRLLSSSDCYLLLLILLLLTFLTAQYFNTAISTTLSEPTLTYPSSSLPLRTLYLLRRLTSVCSRIHGGAAHSTSRTLVYL